MGRLWVKTWGREPTQKEQAPVFLLSALRDPNGANLDRAQIIKGWVDRDGMSHEKIYNVSLSDGRVVDADGKVEPVGNTVNLDTATYSNDIGDVELSAVWTDPDFDVEVDAFYYARVLEIPTPDGQLMMLSVLISNCPRAFLQLCKNASIALQSGMKLKIKRFSPYLHRRIFPNDQG